MTNQQHYSEIILDPVFQEVNDWLGKYRSRACLDAASDKLKGLLQHIKSAAVNSNDSETAKAAWCLEKAVGVHHQYLAAFAFLRDLKHYSAWCHLERAEIELNSLDRHHRGLGNTFGLELIREQIRSIQDIYPYKQFISPEIWHKESRCSVCNAIVAPRNRCKHEVGEIYDGEECCIIVNKMEFLAFALVRSPVQKYSVVFPADPATSGGEPNPLAYQAVDYVIRGLRSPWDRFSLIWEEKIQPHSLFANVDMSDPCPCIAPKGTYAECCSKLDGVLRPHMSIAFERNPPADLENEIFLP